MGQSILILLIVVIIIAVIFLICREILLWYYKINERIKLQKETNELLKKIINIIASPAKEAENKNSVPQTNPEITALYEKWQNGEITELEFKDQRRIIISR